MRFRRKADEPDLPGVDDDLDGDQAAAGTGPFDESEVDLETRGGVDLGSLVLLPTEQTELRLEVDEASGAVSAAVLVGENGGLELRAFAASRGGGAWDELRPQISAEIARMGGTASQQEGPFGTELMCLVPVQTPDGQAATQASRVIGCEGGTWLLRATLMGPVAVDPEAAAPWEEAIRQVVVRRGTEARPPGSPLPLRLPPEARRVE